MGQGQIMVTRLGDPIGDYTTCLELHELRTLEGSDEKYHAMVTFILLTDSEAKMLGEVLAAQS